MARKTYVLLEDDIDGGEAAETLRFALDGDDYEIDVSADHAQQLRSDLHLYITHARRIGLKEQLAPAIAPTRKPARIDKEQLAAMRRWARANGYDVSDRGRVSPEIQDAYNSAW